MVTHFTSYDGEFGGLKYILTSKPTKSENEIIVPRKQPIKIAKPLPGHEIAPNTVANATKIIVLATKIQKLVAKLATRTL